MLNTRPVFATRCGKTFSHSHFLSHTCSISLTLSPFHLMYLTRSSAPPKPPSTTVKFSWPLGGSPLRARMFCRPAFFTCTPGDRCGCVYVCMHVCVCLFRGSTTEDKSPLQYQIQSHSAPTHPSSHPPNRLPAQTPSPKPHTIPSAPTHPTYTHLCQCVVQLLHRHVGAGQVHHGFNTKLYVHIRHTHRKRQEGTQTHSHTHTYRSHNR